jgi:hypothetical protein
MESTNEKARADLGNRPGSGHLKQQRQQYKPGSGLPNKNRKHYRVVFGRVLTAEQEAAL